MDVGSRKLGGEAASMFDRIKLDSNKPGEPRFSFSDLTLREIAHDYKLPLAALGEWMMRLQINPPIDVDKQLRCVLRAEGR
jgi:hypothetical protein